MKAIICFCFVLVCVANGMLIGGNTDKTVTPTELKNNELCTPEQWEGFIASWYPELSTLAFTNISYDFTNKKLALDVEKWHWSQDGECNSKTYSMLFRFDKKKAYFFHDREDGKNCTVRDLEQDFEEFCVPDDAKCLGPSTLGGKLQINSYKFVIENEKRKGDNETWVYFESTPAGIPVTTKYGNDKVNGDSEFYDITSGINDETRFDPPNFCDDNNPLPAYHKGKRSHTAFNLWHLPFRV